MEQAYHAMQVYKWGEVKLHAHLTSAQATTAATRPGGLHSRSAHSAGVKNLCLCREKNHGYPAPNLLHTDWANPAT